MFDDRLKKLRNARGLTQKEAADALGLKTNTYRNYENDEREPTAMILLSIARFYGVTTDYLLNYSIDSSYMVSSKEEDMINEKEKSLLTIFRQLTDAQQDLIIDKASLLVESNEAEAKKKA